MNVFCIVRLACFVIFNTGMEGRASLPPGLGNTGLEEVYVTSLLQLGMFCWQWCVSCVGMHWSIIFSLHTVTHPILRNVPAELYTSFCRRQWDQCFMCENIKPESKSNLYRTPVFPPGLQLWGVGCGWTQTQALFLSIFKVVDIFSSSALCDRD